MEVDENSTEGMADHSNLFTKLGYSWKCACSGSLAVFWAV